MRLQIIAIASLAALPAGAVRADDAQPKRSVAIFAHPDDELFVAPALARAVRQGQDVTLVYATNGDQGPGVSGLDRGERLAALRKREALCAAEALRM